MPFRENEKGIDEADRRFLNTTGDTLLGEINMNSNRIINLPNPISNSEAVNKSYVDTNLIRLPNAITGFRIVKTVTPEDFKTFLTVVAPIGYSPSQIMLIVSEAPDILSFVERSSSAQGNTMETRQTYQFMFVNTNRVVSVEGVIFLCKQGFELISGKKAEIRLL